MDPDGFENRNRRGDVAIARTSWLPVSLVALSVTSHFREEIQQFVAFCPQGATSGDGKMSTPAKEGIINSSPGGRSVNC